MKTTVQIDKLTHKSGDRKGQEFFSVWFFAQNEDHGTECAHIGYFDDEYDANKAGEAVRDAVNITRNMIRDMI